MVSHQTECDHQPCEWNYSQKFPIKSHHPIPTFKFPTSPISTEQPLTTTIAPETTTMEHITKFIKDIITPFTSTNNDVITDTTIITTTENNNIVNSTFSDIVGLTSNTTFDGGATSNSTAIFDLTENTTGSSMIEGMQTGSLPIEIMENSTAFSETMETDTTVLTTISEFASSTAENTIAMLNTTTEKAITFVTEATKKISTSTPSNHHNDFHHDESHQHSHQFLYAILIIIIAILVLIGIILLLIYIRYRKNSFRALHNYYEVSPMKERTASDNGQEEQKGVPPEMYMHFQC